MVNSFGSRSVLDVGGRKFEIHRLAALEKAVIAAATNGIRPIVAVYSFSSVTPTTPAARAQFAAYTASLPRLRSLHR